MRSNKCACNFALAAFAASIVGPEWALRFAQPLLARDDASAQWYVGLLHHLGYGVEKDLAIARCWYERSAAAKYAPAALGLMDLDQMRLNAEGEKYDRANVLSLYQAQHAPEQLTWRKRDCRAAFQVLSVNAAHDSVESQILLGVLYERGIYVEGNDDVALEWYRRAAVQGSEEGCAHHTRLSTAFEGDDGVWDRLEARVMSALARSSRQRGAEPPGTKKAIKWYLEAVAEGDRFACWRLHELYLLDKGVAEDREESAKWLLRACEGHPDEAVIEYLASVRHRVAEVIEEHVLDVALRANLKSADERVANSLRRKLSAR